MIYLTNDRVFKTLKAMESYDQRILYQRCYTSSISIIHVLKTIGVTFTGNVSGMPRLYQFDQLSGRRDKFRLYTVYLLLGTDRK